METILTATIPIIIILVPAFFVYSYFTSTRGLIAGSSIGIVIGIMSNTIPFWLYTTAIILLAVWILHSETNIIQNYEGGEHGGYR